MYNEHWFNGGFMWIIVIAFLFFVFWGTTAFNGNRNMEKRQSALDILKERYAKGEINHEEYEARKRDLIS